MTTEAQLQSNATHDHEGSMAEVLDFVKRLPDGIGTTNSEAENTLRLDRLTVCSALANLRIAGKLRDSGYKRMGAHGKPQTVWVLGDDRHVVLKHRLTKLYKLADSLGFNVIPKENH